MATEWLGAELGRRVVLGVLLHLLLREPTKALLRTTRGWSRDRLPLMLVVPSFATILSKVLQGGDNARHGAYSLMVPAKSLVLWEMAYCDETL